VNISNKSNGDDVYVGLLTSLQLANLFPGQWAAQDRTDIAKIEHASTQRENAEHHGDHAECLLPVQITDYEKSRADDQAKNAAGRAIDESRKPGTIENFCNAHGTPPVMYHLFKYFISI